ncbi:hypothetical protein BKA67DRAFT_532808 [Truncatella angustata]|uniref:Uncharacterized protein n=1 Tax=Truncatella angustata TaxID=152316 RepID=A0A9P8USW6_9PEZI|nr:uncharacterized protein BKA67DRAFT_532808 [Truncatella angustata]KAH6657609.1 hypothetical protein BKA67DRAFT_532808 [Truncatella angustata]KAH8204538.1 hypothetical protein TruAng_001312 [Truncatella angustata]
MLSHLRFHRRGPSNPTSPIPENGPWDAALQPKQLTPDEGVVPAPAIEPRTSTGPPLTGHGTGPPSISQLPPHPQQPPPPPPQQPAPSLPPIARATSTESEHPHSASNREPKRHEEQKAPQRTPYTEQSGFLGGLALQNYRREQQDALRPDPSQASSNHGKPSLSAATSPADRNPSPSFLSPTEHGSSNPTGRRPPGARLHSDVQAAHAQNNAQEAPRDRRGIPFLKNPISNLLLRRKTSHNVLPDLSLRTSRGEPSYQPIRGTRVHDFSAPRPRRVVSSNDVAKLGTVKPDSVAQPPPTLEHKPPPQPARPPPIQEQQEPEPLPQPAPPVPPKDEQAHSVWTSSLVHSKSMSVDTHDLSNLSSKREKNSSRRQSSIPSSISTLSRNASGVSNRDVLSSLPKHMKSTSSRFSFDMIGAAKAEKLLEEKHRQRQQEKEAEPSAAHRDSRFDDFDEDSFDYDAMDYDDGLEEEIPEINYDYDEDIPEINYEYDEEVDGEPAVDPDNDQENFAGFVFQRSDPVSSLASPLTAGLLPTPRDVDGNIIGYAVTKESPETRRFSLPMLAVDVPPQLAESPTRDSPTGLGIEGLDEVIEAHEQISVPQPAPQGPAVPRYLDKDDELYFGSHEFEGEGDGRAIDESLFDLDDTDQYGRPIPGMFASALAQRQKRESDDITSGTSVHSGLSDSTEHTSLSVGLHQKLAALEAHEETNSAQEEPVPPVPDLPEVDDDAMQAALAAAVQKAADTGKFRRNSSPPPPPTDLTITSPTTSGSEESNNVGDDAFGSYDYDDDYGGNGLDDYELDDDAIIAAANADALASDDDGWYGQEFGFYSNPPSQSGRSGHGSSEHNPAWGGYFGPGGVARTKSGHLVSREPNLTPITERSEYSNRNSIMSLQMPNSAGRDAPLQSPGLAQLAMMADDDNMSLSALLKLRSRAWGGSQASLASSREGSPSDRNGATSPFGQERDLSGLGTAHGRKNSAFSIWSVDSGAGSGAGSPTLTMAMAGIPNSTIPSLPVMSSSVTNAAPSALNAPLYTPPPPPLGHTGFPPVIEDEEVELASQASSPVAYSKPPPAAEIMSPTFGVPPERRPGMGHRHKNSADSISYRKEEDSGETRWVLERRRTAESGEIEILGREVIEGGRI